MSTSGEFGPVQVAAQAGRDTLIANAALPGGRVGDAIVRFTAGDRTNHWIVALAFICTALSGLALFHPSLFWLSNIFGGGPWTRVLHPFFGLTMVIGFAFLVFRFYGYNRMTAADWRALPHLGEVEAGRYNAGQKLLFLLWMTCLAVLLVTGFLFWRPYFAGYFPIPLIRVAALLHSFFAFVLISFVIGHVYFALSVRGSIWAMTRGTVTLGWAWRNHRAWFREVTRAARTRSGTD